jgi:hypothetical protein
MTLKGGPVEAQAFTGLRGASPVHSLFFLAHRQEGRSISREIGARYSSELWADAHSRHFEAGNRRVPLAETTRVRIQARPRNGSSMTPSRNRRQMQQGYLPNRSANPTGTPGRPAPVRRPWRKSAPADVRAEVRDTHRSTHPNTRGAPRGVPAGTRRRRRSGRPSPGCKPHAVGKAEVLKLHKLEISGQPGARVHERHHAAHLEG